MAKPYVAHLKENISSQFLSSHKVIHVSAVAIVNPCKALSADSTSLSSYGNESIKTLLQHYGQDKPAQMVYTWGRNCKASPDIARSSN